MGGSSSSSSASYGNQQSGSAYYGSYGSSNQSGNQGRIPDSYGYSTPGSGTQSVGPYSNQGTG